MFESYVAFPHHVCFRSTYAVSRRMCVEQKVIVKRGVVYFRYLLLALKLFANEHYKYLS